MVTTKVTDKFGGRYPGKERRDGKRVVGMRFKVRIHGRVPEAPIKTFCICLKTAWPFPDLTVPCGLQRQRICDLAAADRLACAPAADLPWFPDSGPAAGDLQGFAALDRRAASSTNHHTTCAFCQNAQTSRRAAQQCCLSTRR